MKQYISPLLFVLHVNDLPRVTRHCQVLMYADDTVAFYSGKLALTIESKLIEDLDIIGSWLRNNSLFLNVTKTEAMLFGTQARLSQVTDFRVTFNANPIKRVSEFKYLGVLFDEKISWNAHVKYIISKVGKRLGMLRRIRGSITSHCANTIYLSYVRPILEYCDIVWDSCGVCNSTSLEKLQGRAAIELQ